MIKLFEVENNTIIPTEHCYSIKWLKAIMDNHEESYLKIYAYLFYMCCPSQENPYFNLRWDMREETIINDLDIDFSLEEDDIQIALDKAKAMYETPTVRAYEGIKKALDNIAHYMANTSITDGRDGNIGQIRAVAKDFDSIRQSYKGIVKDLEEEQQINVRGSQQLGYDQM